MSGASAVDVWVSRKWRVYNRSFRSVGYFLRFVLWFVCLLIGVTGGRRRRVLGFFESRKAQLKEMGRVQCLGFCLGSMPCSSSRASGPALFSAILLRLSLKRFAGRNLFILPSSLHGGCSCTLCKSARCVPPCLNPFSLNQGAASMSACC